MARIFCSRSGDLVLADRAQVAARNGGRRDDIRLAGCFQADLPGVELGALAAPDQADIVGELVFGELAPELVEDARKLIDRAIIDAGEPTPLE